MQKPSILIVEDETIVAIDICQTVKMLGYNVLDAVSTGEQALSLLEHQEADLVLMDIKLEGRYDGIETAMEIKNRFSIPFIYLSTFSDDQTLARAKLTEPYGYITKSYDHNDLHSQIEMALYRHRIEQEMAQKEELLSITLKSISDAVIGAGMEGNIISWNKGAEDIFGYEAGEIIGKNLSILIPPFFPNEFPEYLDKIRAGEELEPYETLRKTSNNRILNMSVKISPIKDKLGVLTGVSIIGRDITSRTELQKQVLAMGELERRRIGQDLHDSLGQHLTGISLKLKALSNSLQSSGCMKQMGEVEHISVLVKEALINTRNLAKGLIPFTLKNDGLAVAIQELVGNVQALYSSTVEFQSDLDLIIQDEVINAQLYHITQESLTNCQKHAKATHVKVHLYREENDICLSVEDNGIGLVDLNKEGIGLRIMRYRANIMNAQISIFSPPEGGTRVICKVPIRNHEVLE